MGPGKEEVSETKAVVEIGDVQVVGAPSLRRAVD
jgi:hypothetical protein